MKSLNQSGKIGVMALSATFLLFLSVFAIFGTSHAQYQAPVAARLFVAVTPTGTITPTNPIIWTPWSGAGGSGATTVIVSNVPTPDITKVSSNLNQLTAMTPAVNTSNQATTINTNTQPAFIATPLAGVLNAVVAIRTVVAGTMTFSFAATPQVQNYSKLSPVWMGPNPNDTNVSLADRQFNASSTPVQAATPVATTSFTDPYFRGTNIGTATGNGIVYVGSRAITYSLCPGCTTGDTAILDTVGNVPVSFGGDATASVTILYSAINIRQR